MNKRNLKRFLERQNNIKFEYCNNFLNGNTITYSYHDKNSSDLQENELKTREYQQAKYLVQIKTAKKLKKKYLSDDEIADILEIDIEELSDDLQ